MKIGQNFLFRSRDSVSKLYFGRNFIFQSTGVTLKIWSRSLKSTLLIILYSVQKWLIYTVFIGLWTWKLSQCHQLFMLSKQSMQSMLLVQKKTHKKPILDISKCRLHLWFGGYNEIHTASAFSWSTTSLSIRLLVFSDLCFSSGSRATNSFFILSTSSLVSRSLIKPLWTRSLAFFNCLQTSRKGGF